MLDKSLAALLLLVASSAAVAADEDPVENPRLPRLWKVVQRTKQPQAVVESMAKKLGTPLSSIENCVLDAGGVGVKINLARCADEAQAEAAKTKFETFHGGDELYVVRQGVDVAEIVCSNRFIARKARDVVGWDEPGSKHGGPAYYRATMQVAPLVRCDGMRWNRLFNLLRRSDDPKIAAAIETEAKEIEFADRLPWDKSDEPPKPRVLGVPRVELTREVIVTPFRTSGSRADSKTWTAATEAWPADAPEVQAAAKAALGENPPTSAKERAELVLAWVHENVKYGGDEPGSRWGTTKVIAQGFGRCWDQSDAFVAVCRASGVPARQVGGWILKSEGHVWAEVVVGKDKNDGVEYDVVLAVDPGTTWLGVSEDYVRLWSSDDGRTPFVYWSAPKIEVLACIK
jgi:hypothetical protein